MYFQQTNPSSDGYLLHVVICRNSMTADTNKKTRIQKFKILFPKKISKIFVESGLTDRSATDRSASVQNVFQWSEIKNN